MKSLSLQTIGRSYIGPAAKSFLSFLSLLILPVSLRAWILFFSAGLGFGGGFAWAQIAAPGEDSYRIFYLPPTPAPSGQYLGSFSGSKESGVFFIYPASEEWVVQNSLLYHKSLQEIYRNEFRWILDEEENLVFLSDRNQTPNAAATPTPFLTNIFYRGGATTAFQRVGGESWLFSILNHEMAHLYQLSVKSGTPSRFLKRYFGNILLFPVYFVPLFVFPNVLMPRFFLEGNATWNESRFGMGGRLYSARLRAQMTALVKAQVLSPSRLINFSYHFPIGFNLYSGGSSFYQYLEKKYGPETLNYHFFVQSDSFIIPFLLNKNFLRKFPNEISLKQALQDSIDQHRPRAEQFQYDQRPSTKTLAKAEEVGPLTVDQGKIQGLFHRFLALRPRVFQWPQASAENSNDLNQKLDWSGYTPEPLLSSSDLMDLDRPLGPLFLENEEWVSYGLGITSYNSVEYGGFRGPSSVKKGTEGQYVFEKKFGHALSADVSKSWISPKIYKDGKYWGETRSEARLGPGGDLFWVESGSQFLQKLMKNKDVIFEFRAQDADVLDVDQDGRVLLMASTAAGAGLFQWTQQPPSSGFKFSTEEDTSMGKSGPGLKNGSGYLVRVSPSDAVVQARYISKDRVLLIELSDLGYIYKSISISEALNPVSSAIGDKFHVPYAEPEVKLVKDFSEVEKNKASSSPEGKISSGKAESAGLALAPYSIDEIQRQSKEYNSLTQMRFSSLSLESNYYILRPSLSLVPFFTDPLQYNAVILGYSGGGTYNLQSGFIAYLNSRYRLNYLLSAQSIEGGILTTTEFTDGSKKTELTEITRKSIVRADFSYPLIRNRRQSSKVTVGSAHTHFNSATNRIWDTSTYGNWSWSWKELHPGAMMPTFEVSLFGFVDWNTRTRAYSWGGASISADVGRETYLSFLGDYAQADTDSITLSLDQPFWNHPSFRSQASF